MENQKNDLVKTFDKFISLEYHLPVIIPELTHRKLAQKLIIILKGGFFEDLDIFSQ